MDRVPLPHKAYALVLPLPASLILLHIDVTLQDGGNTDDRVTVTFFSFLVHSLVKLTHQSESSVSLCHEGPLPLVEDLIHHVLESGCLLIVFFATSLE